ncbi:hypothetical protein AAY473_034770 [Plecturocebus cupreus]
MLPRLVSNSRPQVIRPPRPPLNGCSRDGPNPTLSTRTRCRTQTQPLSIPSDRVKDSHMTKQGCEIAFGDSVIKKWSHSHKHGTAGQDQSCPETERDEHPPTEPLDPAELEAILSVPECQPSMDGMDNRPLSVYHEKRHDIQRAQSSACCLQQEEVGFYHALQLTAALQWTSSTSLIIAGEEGL